jgi:anti-sigma B factor antagonist
VNIWLPAIDWALVSRQMSDLEIELGRDGPAQVVRLRGELDLASAPELELALESLQPTASGRLVLDLADCEFIDSAGLSTILHGVQRLREAGGSVRIACPEGHLRDLLRITAIDQSIPVVATRDEALAALGLD